uniref:Uncharacterized protein n=1 Tax=Leersia perrieri TaxID=77586 RepID=A0A1Y8Y4P9_9ORYZ
MIASPTM